MGEGRFRFTGAQSMRGTRYDVWWRTTFGDSFLGEAENMGKAWWALCPGSQRWEGPLDSRGHAADVLKALAEQREAPILSFPDKERE